MSIRFTVLGMVFLFGATDLRAQGPVRIVVMTDSLLAKTERTELELALQKGASEAGADVLPLFGAESPARQRAARFLFSAQVNRIAGRVGVEVRTIDVSTGTVTARVAGQTAPDSIVGLAYILGRQAAVRLTKP
jgi:hypothetical protein